MRLTSLSAIAIGASFFAGAALHADIVILKASEGTAPLALRGKVTPTADGDMAIELADGAVRVVRDSEIAAVLREGKAREVAPLPLPTGDPGLMRRSIPDGGSAVLGGEREPDTSRPAGVNVGNQPSGVVPGNTASGPEAGGPVRPVAGGENVGSGAPSSGANNTNASTPGTGRQPAARAETEEERRMRLLRRLAEIDERHRKFDNSGSSPGGTPGETGGVAPENPKPDGGNLPAGGGNPAPTAGNSGSGGGGVIPGRPATR